MIGTCPVQAILQVEPEYGMKFLPQCFINQSFGG
jgi:hypothetical protein